ncbi:MAG: zf-TFIIB domain-containing protein, partial [Deltaproteobacteria bacterium]|nr:zf-TFIIB domain-containing protein [Deltaproteobacteria bacterium]
MNCPKCGGARLGPLGTSEGVTLDFCPDCRGLLFDPGELAETFELEKDFPDLRAVRAEARRSGITCPACGTGWVELPWQAGTDLVLDLCPGCGLVWLDKGEFPKLEALAAGLDSPSSRLLRAVKTVER